jgi:hypothetical protein
MLIAAAGVNRTAGGELASPANSLGGSNFTHHCELAIPQKSPRYTLHPDFSLHQGRSLTRLPLAILVALSVSPLCAQTLERRAASTAVRVPISLVS